jgi:hypothetical protein
MKNEKCRMKNAKWGGETRARPETSSCGDASDCDMEFSLMEPLRGKSSFHDTRTQGALRDPGLWEQSLRDRRWCRDTYSPTWVHDPEVLVAGVRDPEVFAETWLKATDGVIRGGAYGYPAARGCARQSERRSQGSHIS